MQISTLAEVAADHMVFPFVDVRLLNRQPTGALTQREADILAALGSGSSNRDLAERFGISAHTVKFHLKNIYAKLNLTNRVQAVAVFLSALGQPR